MEKIINNETLKKKKLILLIIIGLLVVTITGYFISPLSNIKEIRVVNNSFIDQNYVLNLSKINEKTKYLFVFPDIRANLLNKDNLISNAKVSLNKDRSVTISIEENRIVGYQIDADDNATYNNLILADGSLVELENEKIQSLALLPLFINISQQHRIIISQQLAKVDIDTLARFAEISIVNFTYDDNMVKLISDDGYTIYCPINYLSQLNSYFEIIKNDIKQPRCILFIDELSSAFITDCKNLNKYQINENGED